MKYKSLWPFCLALTACATASRTIPHASPEEAARFEFPRFDLPKEGLISIDGNMAAAIQLAMEDFLSWGDKPPPGTLPEEACKYRRDAYDVTAAPGPEGVMLVRFVINERVCPPSPSETVDAVTGLPLLITTTYAIDIRTMRILSVGTHVRRQVAG